MLKFADCNIAVGQPNAISGWRIYDSAQIACQAQRCGIQKGLAFCNAALDLHPLDGNAEMCLICRREPFYLPVWMVMPNHTGEFWNVDELERRMRLADVRAVRLAPKYNVLGYSLRDWCSGELLDMLERTGTLALMDAGVKIKKPVSGIAMGLIKNAGEEKYAVLSDILGDEDHLGDMDFKVTGTKDGITATQMDIKVDGLSYEILEKALLQAKEGREYILSKITECIAEPHADLKPHAPRIETMTIPKEFIGAVIGPGGKIIQGMQEETGATITIEEIDNIGRIEIAGTNKKSIDDAMRIIKGIVAVPEVGEVYKGKVRSIMPYGAFVEFLPGKDGLLHISEIDWKRLETVEEAGIKEGDEIDVKLLDIDPKTGKFKLSRKVLLPKPERQERPEKKDK